MSPEEMTKGELTRAAIINAAHDLIISQGYHGTSVRQIAQRAGIALGGIYNHFCSKEDIFRDVFLTYHPYHEVLPTIETAQGFTAEALLHNAAELMQVAIAKRPQFLNLLFIEIVEFKNVHTRELFAELLPRGMQILNKIKQAPDKIRSIPEPILIRAFIGLFFSYYITELIITDIAPPEFSENAMHHFVDIYLHGILEISEEK